MNLRNCVAGLVALTALSLLPAATPATSLQKTMDFSGGAGGKLSFTTGVGNDFSVTGASINLMEAFPSLDKVKVMDGSMNFTTAGCLTGCFANVLESGKKTVGYMTNATFKTGGSLVITGELPGMSAPVILLEGVFGPGLNSAGKPGDAGPFVDLNSETRKGGFNGSLDITEINPAIYTAFLPYKFQDQSATGKSYLSQVTIDLSFLVDAPVKNHKTLGTWSGDVGSSDALVKPVPEPSTLLLLGASLVAIAGFLRRRLSFAI